MLLCCWGEVVKSWDRVTAEEGKRLRLAVVESIEDFCRTHSEGAAREGPCSVSDRQPRGLAYLEALARPRSSEQVG